MTLPFYKYQGTGNDFIVIDNRVGALKLNTQHIAHLCHRRFGIGADGLMLLENSTQGAFKMVYYNADGKESTMCGNGGRCIVAFAKKLGIIESQCTFQAIDGLHSAFTKSNGNVVIQMIDVHTWNLHNHDFIVNTGSPHYVKFCSTIQLRDFVEQARSIRNSEPYKSEGINVNFVQIENDTLHIRTFERGVEDETLSCGTGVVAAAIANHQIYKGKNQVDILTQGGTLNVSFEYTNNQYSNIFLEGPAQFVFEGSFFL